MLRPRLGSFPRLDGPKVGFFLQLIITRYNPSTHPFSPFSRRLDSYGVGTFLAEDLVSILVILSRQSQKESENIILRLDCPQNFTPRPPFFFFLLLLKLKTLLPLNR